MDRDSPIARLRSFLLLACLVLALSFAIAWPIWIFATKAKGAYSLAAALAAAILIAVRATRGWRRRLRSRRVPP
jgi:hypothetical protein